MAYAFAPFFSFHKQKKVGVVWEFVGHSHPHAFALADSAAAGAAPIRSYLLSLFTGTGSVY